MSADDREAAIALLRWYVEMGADEAIGLEAADRLAPPEAIISSPATSAPVPRQSPRPVPAAPPPALTESLGAAAQSARRLAASADSVEALAGLVAGFDGCPLKRTATNTVFTDGNPTAPVMIIGEAPGADEDRIGRPFVGRAGQLLDRMLAAIDLDRSSVLITNVVYWRPPGNRTPTAAEIASCLPFALRLIALVHPKILVLSGGTAAGALLPQGQGITRLRGRWFDLAVPGLDQPVPTLPMFHPSFLLRTPARKRETWRDLLSLRARLDELLAADNAPRAR
jgi:uracil-DNA glycosylase